LSDIVQASIEMSRPLIDQSGHELSVTLPDEPIWLDGDPARLSQVLMNLLNNAAKYTEPGGQIWLNASRRTTEIEIAITDTGIGIAPEKLANLFDLFYQADRSLERAHGGLGIGLSLVRRFVEMHGGTVTAHSEGLGMGSQFVVRLPVLAEPPASASLPTKDLDQGRASSRRILVVDDNHDSAKMLATLLRLTGNEVETAFDGLEALQTGERFGPEVVLLDIGMPRLNGYETCRRIRQQPWGKEALLIAQTGWGQNEDKRRTAEAGFDAHFVKPVSLAALNRLLDKWQPSRV
jgi:CheY-like chemotaxis protein